MEILYFSFYLEIRFKFSAAGEVLQEGKVPKSVFSKDNNKARVNSNRDRVDYGDHAADNFGLRSGKTSFRIQLPKNV